MAYCAPVHIIIQQPTIFICYLLGTSDLVTMRLLDGIREVRGFKHAFVATRIRPSKSPPQQSHIELSLFEMGRMDPGYRR